MHSTSKQDKVTHTHSVNGANWDPSRGPSKNDQPNILRDEKRAWLAQDSLIRVSQLRWIDAIVTLRHRSAESCFASPMMVDAARLGSGLI
jgi:hypothetical protein